MHPEDKRPIEAFGLCFVSSGLDKVNEVLVRYRINVNIERSQDNGAYGPSPSAENA